jgi:pimeloyl-ACP methyl ester carboxylesterase
MESITHHGRTTAYRRHEGDGDGEPILFVHGWGGSHRHWSAQDRLADERPVVALDLSGHGESDDVDATPGYETLSAYVDDVVAVARETDAGVLCGSSLGSGVALMAVLERAAPLSLSGLVLAGAGARLAVPDDLLTWVRTDFERAKEYLHGPNRLFHEPEEHLRAVTASAFDAAGQAVTDRDFRTAHEFDMRDRLAAVDVPTLAVVGEHDVLTPPWYHETLAAAIPDAEWTTVPDAAHLAMLERPAAFNERVSSLLAT